MVDKKKHIARVEETVEFADGSDRVIRPLTIKNLRKFVKIIEGLEVTTNEVTDEAIDKMVDASFLVLHQSDTTTKKEDIEDVLDLDTFQKIMAVAMGNRLFDPNLPVTED